MAGNWWTQKAMDLSSKPLDYAFWMPMMNHVGFVGYSEHYGWHPQICSLDKFPLVRGSPGALPPWSRLDWPLWAQQQQPGSPGWPEQRLPVMWSTLHIYISPLRMRTLVAGCYSGLVCMASGGAMAYCALARTWLCPAPRMGGLDHGAQGACSAQAKKE